MNDNAKKWVEALRSGEYAQGRNRLRNADAFCCLGVACEVYARSGGDGEWVDNVFYVASERGETNVLPSAVKDWLGLDTRAGDYRGGALTIANDAGASFERIAEIIENEPRELFA